VPRRKPTRVAVLHNVDYEESTPEGDPGYAARADVAQVVGRVAAELDDGAHQVHLVPVDGDLVCLRARIETLRPDCVFNLCESLAEDARLESAVPLLLSLLGVPCTGSPPEALSDALYKDRVKRRLEAAGIPTPAGIVMRSGDDPSFVAGVLGWPLIVKPLREDGSVGITAESVVHDAPSLRAQVDAVVVRHRQPSLVEQYVAGRELNVALVGFPTARVLPLSEIDFSRLPVGAPPIVSYDAKWRPGSPEDEGTRPVLHPDLPPQIAARVRRVAVEAFRALGLRDYGRVDVRLAPSGLPYVVDVNPNCDLSPTAGMARAAAAVGLDYAMLIKLIVRYALRRRSKEAALVLPARTTASRARL
jgi:D-alanine-D-alanine ligase